MLQKALVMLFLFAASILGSLMFFANLDTVSADRPLPLREVEEGTDDLAQWKTIWNEDENQLKQVAVIMNEPDMLKVRIDYNYSGSHGDEVFACGSIDERSRHVNWTCKPVAIKPGEGSAVLSMQTSDDSQAQACSRYVVVRIYQGGEEPFYSNYFHYKKAWIKDASGMWGRLRQFFHSCHDELNK